MAEFVILLRAYFRGSQDYKRGLSVSDNPYPPGPLVRHRIARAAAAEADLTNGETPPGRRQTAA
jgi:hypothetical protein